jgi:hypothetical protein
MGFGSKFEKMGTHLTTQNAGPRVFEVILTGYPVFDDTGTSKPA